MTAKQRKALGRFFLALARSTARMREAGTLKIATIYKDELEKIEQAALEVVEELRDASGDR